MWFRFYSSAMALGFFLLVVISENIHHASASRPCSYGMSADFYCNSDPQRCVSVISICDGEPDCPNGADEEPDACKIITCPYSMHRCSDGRCLWPDSLCDGVPDCLDESDENLLRCNKSMRHTHIKPTCLTLECNGTCISENLLCDGSLRLCSGSTDMEYEYCQVRAASGRCSNPGKNFFCGDGQCVDKDLVCDRQEHCRNGGDEDPSMCASRGCRRGEWECPNNKGICLSLGSELCDGQSQCPDGADESESMCQADECPLELGLIKCPLSSRCGSISDVCESFSSSSCPLNETEKETLCNQAFKQLTCFTGDASFSRHGSRFRASTFHCGNGQCVGNHEVCDGWRDCENGADETAELCYSYKCKDEEFNCYDGKDAIVTQAVCLSETIICDGSQNCPNGADEKQELCSSRNCSEFYFPCGDGQCVYWSQVCDGAGDCNNGVDEAPQQCSPNTTTNVPCPEEFFRCVNGKQCLAPWQVCDSFSNCRLDGSDEDEDMCANRVCPSNSLFVDFDCGNGHCIPNVQVCDGLVRYCADGKDEDKEMCAGRVCQPHQFHCNATGQCLPPEYVCNGFVTCKDAADETPEACIWKQKAMAESSAIKKMFDVNLVFQLSALLIANIV